MFFFFFFNLCLLPLLLCIQHWFNKLSFSSGAITRISPGMCFPTWVFCGACNKRRKIIVFIHSAGDIQHAAILAQALPGDLWSCLMLDFTFFLPSPPPGVLLNQPPHAVETRHPPVQGNPQGSSTIRILDFDKKAG